MAEESDVVAQRSTAAWRAVLQDPEVRAWHEKLAMRSTLTADEYVRILDRYCRAMKTNPASIVVRAKDQDGGRRAIEHQLQNFAKAMRESHKPSSHGEDDSDLEATKRCARGHMPMYVNRFPKVLRSYLDHHDIVLRKIYVGDTDATLVENEPLLTPEQLRDIVTAASPRGRVIVAFVAWSGLRPEVLGNHDASDGLVIGDLPDLELADSGIGLTKHPLQVVVRRELSKIRKRYFSFLCGEGAVFLEEYLARRAANGEVLTRDSPIVRPDYNRERQGRPSHMRGSPFLETMAITSEIRATLRARELHVRPYGLRNYFVSRMESALRDGKVSLHDKLFFEGRKTAIDLRYSHHKQLPRETIEELRNAYANAEPYLGAKPSPSPNELRIPIADLQANAAQIQAVLTQLSTAIATAKKGRHGVSFTVNVAPTD
ncbi:MAG TPA: hypothetical protein VI999_07035 [Thermoplasmata archaeon]|nr:hypothetical protein [Thermoplasmata archaeon]